MRKIIITENLPDVIDINQLQSEIRLINTYTTEAVATLREPSKNVVYVVDPETYIQTEAVSEITRAIVVSRLDYHINDQDVINAVQNHVCKSLWKKLGSDGALYRTVRRRLIAYVMVNYATMTPEELKEASQHFATPAEIRNMFFSTAEQIELGEIFNTKATEDRLIRRDQVSTILFNHFSYSDIIKISNSFITLGLLEKYVTWGLEGISEGDPEGLFDFFEATPGTSFEVSGFKHMDISPINLTIDEITTKIMNILRITIN